jgi:hypothetical protein
MLCFTDYSWFLSYYLKLNGINHLKVTELCRWWWSTVYLPLQETQWHVKHRKRRWKEKEAHVEKTPYLNMLVMRRATLARFTTVNCIDAELFIGYIIYLSFKIVPSIKQSISKAPHKMRSICWLKTLGSDYPLMQHDMPEQKPQQHCCGNLKTHIHHSYEQRTLHQTKMKV